MADRLSLVHAIERAAIERAAAEAIASEIDALVRDNVATKADLALGEQRMLVRLAELEQRLDTRIDQQGLQLNTRIDQQGLRIVGLLTGVVGLFDAILFVLLRFVH